MTRGNSGVTTLTVTGGSFAGTIQNGAGQIALVKGGSGTLTLSGTNSYSGGTTLPDYSGNVTVTNAAGLGTGTVTIGTGNTNPTCTLQLSGDIAVTSIAQFNFSSRTVGAYPSIENISGNNSVWANLNINNTGGSAVNLYATAGTLTLTGKMTSTGLSTARGITFGLILVAVGVAGLAGRHFCSPAASSPTARPSPLSSRRMTPVLGRSAATIPTPAARRSPAARWSWPTRRRSAPRAVPCSLTPASRSPSAPTAATAPTP